MRLMLNPLTKTRSQRKTYPDFFPVRWFVVLVKAFGITVSHNIFLLQSTETWAMFASCDSTIASWSEDGKQIEIKDIERFEKEVLHKYFETVKFASFNRQLNFYGFKKVPSTELRRSDSSGNECQKILRFQNDLFQKGRPDLLKDIQRRQPGSGDRNHEQEIKDLQEKIKIAEVTLHSMQNLYEEKIREMETKFEAKINDLIAKYQKDVDNWSIL